MSWIEHLPSDVHSRLSNCCTIKADLPFLVNTKWWDMQEKGKDKEGFTKEDALICILEHLDCNDQFFDLTKEEYNELKGE